VREGAAGALFGIDTPEARAAVREYEARTARRGDAD
jgi:hypothetical protein